MCFAIRFGGQKVIYNWTVSFASQKESSSSESCQEKMKNNPSSRSTWDFWEFCHSPAAVKKWL
jgi:hypothetical protein